MMLFIHITRDKRGEFFGINTVSSFTFRICHTNAKNWYKYATIGKHMREFNFDNGGGKYFVHICHMFLNFRSVKKWYTGDKLVRFLHRYEELVRYLHICEEV